MNVLSVSRPLFQPGSVTAHLVAGVIVAAATVLRFLLDPWLSGLPYIVFFPAVVLATFLCGSAAGLMAFMLSVLSASLFISPAIYRTCQFGVGALTVVATSGLLRAAAARVERLNETLRLSEAKFRGLLESAPDAMVIVDDARRIAWINARCESLFGYPRAELLGKPIETLWPEHSRGPYRAQIGLLGQTQPCRTVALDGVCKSGHAFPVEISIGLLDTGSGLVLSHAIRDVTERRLIEARLAEASKAKSDFLARMSHELRTPLNAIIGFSELIRDAAIAPIDARYREYGGDINGAGRHLLTIINDILDISKIESGHLELHEEMVPVAEIYEGCERIIAVMAEEAEVTLSMSLAAALPSIRCDPLRLRQVLLNIMSNAVKFTPAGGHVRVSASSGKDGVTIAVEDTGIGMNAEDMAIAMEPFRQIEGTLTRRFDGTGLGLPLANALVQLHGGRLEIESVPLKGTTVRIRLPQERAASAAA